MAPRARLDNELVRRSLARSRIEAQSLIEDGRVLVNGSIASKPAHLVAPGDAIVVSGPARRFVSRGGDKLLAALEHFGIPVKGCVALDAGASTGGFTDCLLQMGVRRVVALDVGHGQLHPKIRSDPRVHVLEKFNVRNLSIADTGGLVDLVVADLSFISLTTVLPALVSVLKESGRLILLVKPQFEVGRSEASRGRGVITDPALHRSACDSVAAACSKCGVEVVDIIPSPILGQRGNREFLLHGVLRGRLPG